MGQNSNEPNCIDFQEIVTLGRVAVILGGTIDSDCVFPTVIFSFFQLRLDELAMFDIEQGKSFIIIG